MALGIEQIEDFVNSIHQKFAGEDRRAAQDISLPLQQYKYASRLFTGNIQKDTMSTSQCKWKLKTKTNNNFQVVSLYHRDRSDRTKVLEEAELKWGLTTNNYHYDIDEEIFRQGGDQIYDYIKDLETDLETSFYTGMEDLIFGEGPSGPTQKPFPPVSLLWWITATQDGVTDNNAAEGFNGHSPIGWTDNGIGGIKTADYEQWRNRTFPYTDVSRDDFVEKVVNSMDLCQFEPPVERPDIVSQHRSDWDLLTTHSRVAALRRLLQISNDDIGDDVAKHSGKVHVRGVAVDWVPAWTNSASENVRTDGVIIGINWSTFRCYHAKGRTMRKRPAFQHKEMSNVRVRPMDDSAQLVCFNRRANFRGYSTAAVTETT
tara:strand:+ start:902 stop:2020 length:1119 start_codon:yes stop_codon:yes gene_type:complete